MGLIQCGDHSKYFSNGEYHSTSTTTTITMTTTTINITSTFQATECNLANFPEGDLSASLQSYSSLPPIIHVSSVTDRKCSGHFESKVSLFSPSLTCCCLATSLHNCRLLLPLFSHHGLLGWAPSAVLLCLSSRAGPNRKAHQLPPSGHLLT